MDDLWTEASRDAEAENSHRLLTAARVATQPVWTFLAAARSDGDFINRKALVAERLDAVCSRLAEGSDFAVLRHDLEAALDADYETISDERRREAEVRARVAAHTATLKQAGDGGSDEQSKENAPSEETHPSDTAEGGDHTGPKDECPICTPGPTTEQRTTDASRRTAGWSCTREAGETMDALTKACVAETGRQNVFSMNGQEVFWERSSREQADGSIAGAVWGMDGTRKASFKIGEDGSLTGPAALKALIKSGAKTSAIAAQAVRAVGPQRAQGLMAIATRLSPQNRQRLLAMPVTQAVATLTKVQARTATQGTGRGRRPFARSAGQRTAAAPTVSGSSIEDVVKKVQEGMADGASPALIVADVNGDRRVIEVAPKGFGPIHTDMGSYDEFYGTTGSRRTAKVSLTNIRFPGGIGSDVSDGAVFVGTDPSGAEVSFRVSRSDAAAILHAMTSDLAVNFTGLDVDEADIITTASRTAAGRKYRVSQPPAWAGKWVVQYYDPSMDLWFDHGDPPEPNSQAAAEEKMKAIQAEGLKTAGPSYCQVCGKQGTRTRWSGPYCEEHDPGDDNPNRKKAGKSRNCENGNHSSCGGGSCGCTCHDSGRTSNQSGACADGDHGDCQMSHGTGPDDCGCPRCRRKTGARRTAASRCTFNNWGAQCVLAQGHEGDHCAGDVPGPYGVPKHTCQCGDPSKHLASKTAGENPFPPKDSTDEKKPPADKPPAPASGGGDLDPTTMQPGQQVTLGYTLTGSAGGGGTTPATFESTDGTSYFFTYDRGRFGITQQGGKWVDAAGTEFTFEDGGGQQQQPPGGGGQQPPQFAARRRMASAFDGRWYVHTNSVRPDGTKDSFFTRGFDTEQEARAWADEVKADEFSGPIDVEVQSPMGDRVQARRRRAFNESEYDQDVQEVIHNTRCPSCGSDNYGYNSTDGASCADCGHHWWPPPPYAQPTASRRTASYYMMSAWDDRGYHCEEWYLGDGDMDVRITDSSGERVFATHIPSSGSGRSDFAPAAIDGLIAGESRSQISQRMMEAGERYNDRIRNQGRRRTAANPYMPEGNGYMPSPDAAPGMPDDVMDGPGVPNPDDFNTNVPARTTKPRQIPTGGEAPAPRPGEAAPKQPATASTGWDALPWR